METHVVVPNTTPHLVIAAIYGPDFDPSGMHTYPIVAWRILVPEKNKEELAIPISTQDLVDVPHVILDTVRGVVWEICSDIEGSWPLEEWRRDVAADHNH
jgi:hypothetical protein